VAHTPLQQPTGPKKELAVAHKNAAYFSMKGQMLSPEKSAFGGKGREGKRWAMDLAVP
jgi:hypothetical protein